MAELWQANTSCQVLMWTGSILCLKSKLLTTITTDWYCQLLSSITKRLRLPAIKYYHKRLRLPRSKLRSAQRLRSTRSYLLLVCVFLKSKVLKTILLWVLQPWVSASLLQFPARVQSVSRCQILDLISYQCVRLSPATNFSMPTWSYQLCWVRPFQMKTS